MPPPNFQSELWNEQELEIWENSGYKCVICQNWGDTLHEIVPKSRSPKNWHEPSNRVPVCVPCHMRIHHDGTRIWKQPLIELRKQRLKEHNVNSL
jgi:5-methylcytosine-specific restriction endonuclease McrA